MPTPPGATRLGVADQVSHARHVPPGDQVNRSLTPEGAPRACSHDQLVMGCDLGADLNHPAVASIDQPPVNTPSTSATTSVHGQPRFDCSSSIHNLDPDAPDFFAPADAWTDRMVGKDGRGEGCPRWVPPRMTHAETSYVPRSLSPLEPQRTSEARRPRWRRRILGGAESVDPLDRHRRRSRPISLSHVRIFPGAS